MRRRVYGVVIGGKPLLKMELEGEVRYFPLLPREVKRNARRL